MQRYIKIANNRRKTKIISFLQITRQAKSLR
jgi:hypothetical protein